jgi:diguanylate cyclase (GGDEF)-like protein
MRNSSHIDKIKDDPMEFLAGLPIFEGVDLPAISDDLEHCELISLEKGQVLLSPTKVNTHLYVLLKGKLSIHFDLEDPDPIARIESGECVGEMSVFESEMPSAHVIAASEATLLGIHKEIFWQLIDNSNSLAKNMLHLLLQRLRSGNEALSGSYDKLRDQEISIYLDPLTGIHNRRWLNEMFQRELQRCQKRGVALALIMIDVDHFKNFNDQNGHLAGDECLKSIATTLHNILRPNEMVARFGGEEFSVLLPDTCEDDCITVAERLRSAVSKTAILDKQGERLPSVTISLGIALMKQGDSFESLLDEADRALYQAKDLGRDRVVTSSFLPDTPAT